MRSGWHHKKNRIQFWPGWRTSWTTFGTAANKHWPRSSSRYFISLCDVAVKSITLGIQKGEVSSCMWCVVVHFCRWCGMESYTMSATNIHGQLDAVNMSLWTKAAKTIHGSSKGWTIVVTWFSFSLRLWFLLTLICDYRFSSSSGTYSNRAWQVLVEPGEEVHQLQVCIYGHAITHALK